MKVDKNIIIFFHIPLLCQILSLYNRILIYFGLKYLYLPVYIIGLTLLFSCRKGVKWKNRSVFALAYLIVSIVLGVVHLAFAESIEATILGTMVYVLPLLYWAIYVSSTEFSYFREIVWGLRPHVLILCVFAMIQYFVSPTLWGLLADGEDMIQWAAGGDFSDYSDFLRATAYLPSSQALGMFCGLYLVLYHYLFKTDSFAIVLYFFLVLAGVFSGCKSFYMIILVYALYRLFTSGNLKVAIGLIIGILIFILILSYFKEEFGFIERLFDLEKLKDDEKGGRLSIYEYFLTRSTLFGQGAGVIQNVTGGNRLDQVAESYIVQMIYELGFFAFLQYALFLCNSYFSSKSKILIVVAFLSMCVVHVFNGFFMFIFWGVFFYRKKNQVVNYSHVDIYK